MSLATALGLLQGVQQLQTASVAKQATGFGSGAKFSRTTPGTALYVNKATGLTLAQTNGSVQAQAQLGSQGTPFASLEEALSTLAAPSTQLAYETPRTIYLGPGEYTVGAQIIRRSISFHMDDAARIVDLVSIESAAGPFPTSTVTTAVQFIVAGDPQPSLPAGVDISQNGTSTRQVTLRLEGVIGTEVNATAAVAGQINLDKADSEIHAPGMALNASNGSTFGATTATTLEALLIEGHDVNFNRPIAVVVSGVLVNRLYSTRMSTPGSTWTGGTLQIDPATNFDFVAGGWVKLAPGPVAPVVMV